MRLALAAVALIASFNCVASDLKLKPFRVDFSRSPKTIAQTVSECLRNEKCAQALKEGAAAFVIPVTDADFSSIDADGEPDGETTRYNVRTDNGYQICGIEGRVNSTAPADGARASTLDIALHPDRMHIVTWTPIRQLGEGNAWVDADIVITEVANHLADTYRNAGKFSKSPSSAGTWVYRCRGKGGDSERTAAAIFGISKSDIQP
jgi:hypothetical protein